MPIIHSKLISRLLRTHVTLPSHDSLLVRETQREISFVLCVRKNKKNTNENKQSEERKVD